MPHVNTIDYRQFVARVKREDLAQALSRSLAALTKKTYMVHASPNRKRFDVVFMQITPPAKMLKAARQIAKGLVMYQREYAKELAGSKGAA